MTINRHFFRLRWSTVAAAACLALCLPSLTQGMSCHTTCRPTVNASLPINSQCYSDCSGCISIASNQCTNYFIPVWNTYSTDNGKAQDYQSFYCLQACPLPWWGWLLISVGALLLIASIGFACYSCVQRRKRNRQAAIEAFHSQLEHGQNPYPQQQYSAQAYPLNSASSAKV